MALKEESIRLVFGLKVKQLRMAANLSLAELAERTGLSISYINEIEKGKKYPKAEKIAQLAEALGVSFDKLVSLKVDKTLAPVLDILEGDLLNEIPLELFGIDKGKIIEIVANAPAKVAAFISTLTQMAHLGNVTGEHFYFAALRSYQELHENHFEDLEREAARCVVRFGLPAGAQCTSAFLKDVLQSHFGYVVKEISLDTYPELLHIRSVFIPKGKTLLINDRLAEDQKAFLCAKELGHAYLGLAGQRTLTTPWPRATCFDQVLNNSRASYFAGAVLIPPAGLVAKLEQFFAQRQFSDSAFLGMMLEYNSSPEMFMVRLTNILPRHFGLNGLFFQRFDFNGNDGSVTLGKELHLARNQDPRDVLALNNAVTQWTSNSVFSQMQGVGPMAFVQRFLLGNRSFIVMAMARPAKREIHRKLAVCLGFEVNTPVARKVAFALDKSIIETEASPLLVDSERQARFESIEMAMQRLLAEVSVF